MNQFEWPDPPRQTAYPVAKAGFPFIFAASFITAVFALLGMAILAILGTVVTLFICFFFRDPDRAVPNLEGTLVSPADGKVIAVEPLPSSQYSEGPCQKISIFMNIFNVHVNRVPCAGTVKEIDYFPGKFFNASLDKASAENEHNALMIETESGRPLCMVQIAGLVARRIICAVQRGHAVTKGQRMGLICFGSRVDLYLPEDAVIGVTVGDRVKAGTSIIGELR
jgi:phosphatidylserine decarboxylase